MNYVDFYLFPLPKKNIEAYRALAQKAGEVWIEHGALAYKECIIEDEKAEGLLMFKDVAGTKDDETVVAAYVLYNSREHRDAVNAKVMSDPRMKDACGGDNSPFDIKRMAYGGFTPLVNL